MFQDFKAYTPLQVIVNLCPKANTLYDDNKIK